MFPANLLDDLLDAIYECGTIMSEPELVELAIVYYGEDRDIIDGDGNVVDTERVVTRRGLQEIADIYTDGFDCINY